MLNPFWFISILFAIPNFSPILTNVILTPPGGNYTGLERAAIEQFRILVEPELYRDFMKRDEYLIRWIRDQDFNLEKAQRKLLISLKWRLENDVDSAVDEDFSDIERLCPYSVDGRDKAGRPILTASLGACPVRRLVVTGNIQKLRRMIYFGFEICSKIVQDLQSQGKSVVDGVVIGDINNFSLREHGCLRCIPIMIDAITLYESYYPQYVHEIHVINVPRAFESLFAIASPFLSDYTRQRLHLHGFDKDEWQPVVLRNISPDQLEPQFGGTKKHRKFAPLSSPKMDSRK